MKSNKFSFLRCASVYTHEDVVVAAAAATDNCDDDEKQDDRDDYAYDVRVSVLLWFVPTAGRIVEWPVKCVVAIHIARPPRNYTEYGWLYVERSRVSCVYPFAQFSA